MGSARHAAGAVAACVPPSHRSASCNAGASPTIQRSRRDRDNEAVLSRAFTPNGGLVVQSGARSLRHRDAIIGGSATDVLITDMYHGPCGDER